jgi:hypothetical protein
MGFAIDGSFVYMSGDDDPFQCTLAPDLVVDKLESAAQDRYLPLPGKWTHRDTKEQHERTFYVKPREVKAVAPHCIDPDAEDDEE